MTLRAAKPVRLTAHARGYLERRGFEESEVEEAIRTGRWRRARNGRLQSSSDYPYYNLWNGVFYTTKRVRPVFVDLPHEIVVITVYTYFF